jgi:Rps23 Pro-64 3,4-dihydroxylase Tpa1-like proline 4-hydroxylase
MIHFIDSILDKRDLCTLQKECHNFKTSHPKNKNNQSSYNKMILNQNKISLFKEKLEKIVFEKINLEYNLIPNSSTWINCVDSESNKNDDFHVDTSDLSLLVYLNENFEGGELEYKDENENIKTYTPKTNSGLIINNKLLHRVLPVRSGLRFSLVCFFVNKNIKVKKTLL